MKYDTPITQLSKTLNLPYGVVYNIIRNKNCYTCSTNFDSEFIACFYCRINIHYECYNNFNSNRDFDLCPMCQRVATLYHSDLEKEKNLDDEVLYTNLVLD